MPAMDEDFFRRTKLGRLEAKFNAHVQQQNAIRLAEESCHIIVK